MTHEQDKAEAVGVQDPILILAGIRQFGLAPDGADLSDLESVIRALVHPDAVTAERERIAQALDEEADSTPCAEDAVVVRDCARLVRADFSYDEAERLAAHPSSRDDVLEEAAKIAERQSGMNVNHLSYKIAAAIRAAKGGGHHG